MFSPRRKDGLLRKVLYPALGNGCLLVVAWFCILFYNVFESFAKPLLWAVVSAFVLSGPKKVATQEIKGWLREQKKTRRLLPWALTRSIGFRCCDLIGLCRSGRRIWWLNVLGVVLWCWSPLLRFASESVWVVWEVLWTVLEALWGAFQLSNVLLALFLGYFGLMYLLGGIRIVSQTIFGQRAKKDSKDSKKRQRSTAICKWMITAWLVILLSERHRWAVPLVVGIAGEIWCLFQIIAYFSESKGKKKMKIKEEGRLEGAEEQVIQMKEEIVNEKRKRKKKRRRKGNATHIEKRGTGKETENEKIEETEEKEKEEKQERKKEEEKQVEKKKGNGMG